MGNMSQQFGANLDGILRGTYISSSPKKGKVPKTAMPFKKPNNMITQPKFFSIAQRITQKPAAQIDLSKISPREARELDMKYNLAINFKTIPQSSVGEIVVDVSNSGYIFGPRNAPLVPIINTNPLDRIICDKISNLIDPTKKTIILPTYANAEKSVFYILRGHAPDYILDESFQESPTFVIDELVHFFTKEALRNFKDGKNYFKRNDMKSLEEKILGSLHTNRDARFIITHAVDAEGKLADLPGIIQTAKKYNFEIILDISHDFMTLGKKGCGVLEVKEIPKEDYKIFRYFIGGFDKSIGSSGGFIMVPEQEYENDRFRIPETMLSVGLTDSDYKKINKNFDLLTSEKGSIMRAKLKEKTRIIAENLAKIGYKMTDSESPILGIICSDAGRVSMMDKYFRDNQIYGARFIGPAVVNSNSNERLRISVNLQMTQKKKDKFLSVAKDYYPVYNALENNMDPSSFNPPDYIMKYYREELKKEQKIA